MERNCYSCNHYKEESNLCEVAKFTKDKVVPVAKPELNCPVHSEKEIEEFRYMRAGTTLKEAEDVCVVCGKMVGQQHRIGAKAKAKKVSMNQDGEWRIVESGNNIACPDCVGKIDSDENGTD